MSAPTPGDIVAAARSRAEHRFGRADWALSERDFELLTRVDGEHAEDWARLGFARLELGRTADGARCLQKALELDPEHQAARVHFGEALIRLGQIRRGLVLIKSVWDERGSEMASPAIRRAGAALAAARLGANLRDVEKVVESLDSPQTTL